MMRDNGGKGFSSLTNSYKLCSGNGGREVDADNEMKKLKMELVKRMDLYTVACKDASSTKEMGALQQWRMEEQKRLLKEARLAKKKAAEKDKAKKHRWWLSTTQYLRFWLLTLIIKVSFHYNDVAPH
ncbi:hypothetical protein L1887_38077 [Cichorium endivia]|nr:hypothetical protein L1887_38077 [Cichorium endivia]